MLYQGGGFGTRGQHAGWVSPSPLSSLPPLVQGRMDGLNVYKGFGTRWPHPASSASSGIAGVLCSARGERGSIPGARRLSRFGGRGVFIALHTPAGCVFGG